MIGVLGADPSLWSTIPGAGDDCLLFHKEDFDAPQSSSTLSRLTSHSDPRIQVLSSLFESMVYLSPLQVPSLDGNTPQSPVPSPPTNSSVPAWLSDYVSLSQDSTVPTQSQVESEASSESPAGSAGWVLDFIDPPQVAASRSFDSSFAIPRVMAIVAILAIPGLSAVALPVHVVCVIGLLLFEQIVLLVNYSRTPAVIEKRAVQTLQRKELSELSSVKKAMRENEKFRDKLRAEENGKRSKLFIQESQLQKQESNEQNQVQSRLRSAIDAINRRRQTIGQEEAAALSRVQADIGNKIASIDKHIGTIDRAQQDEISEGMKTMQRQFLTNYLQSYRIQDATIPGIGESLKYSLRHYGFVTAADVDQYSVQQVPGIGATKAAAIETWRQRRVNEAFSQMPPALPAQEIDKIVTKYEQQRQWLVSQRQSEQVRLNTDVAAIRSRYASMRPPLDAEQAVAQDSANRDRQGIVDRYAQDYARLSQQMSLLAKEYVEKYATLDEEAARVRKQLLQHNWELAKIQRELSTFANISFRRYLWAACADYRGKA